MLVIKNEEVLEHEGLKQVIKDFRRVQVSRFPIEVHFRETYVKFYDSRFTDKKPVAVVEVNKDDKGDEVFILTSRLILNDRFVRGNDRRTQKHTKDPKKLLRYMREYILPWKSFEIALNNLDEHTNHVDRWVYQASALMRDLCNLDRDAVMQEMVRMKAVGYTPQTEKFAQVMENGLSAWEEAKRRTSRQVMRVHVFFNPDQTVELFCDDKMGYGGITQGTTAFPSLEHAPLCIQHHVAMLRMMNDGEFIAEVGTKIDANNYWVEVFPE